tara:strand:- start:1869 stop:2861 length:993 start_codon:yes stop_codon:yes gene_type:complete
MYDTVVSFFDGMSGARIALDRIRSHPREYHAFEIDKYATAVSRYRYPDIIRHGDARNWTKLKGKKIDLLVAGFPCQSYSISGLRKFQSDPRDMSKVLLDALRGLAIDKVLIENVASMPSEWRDYFTQTFKEIFPDIECYEENSKIDSAQQRRRLYWTNIKFTRSEDKGIVLNDILEDGAMADRDKSYCLDANYFKGGNLSHYYKRSKRQIVFDDKGHPDWDKCKQVGEADLKGYDIIKRVYSRQGKSPTLTTMQGGWRMPKVDVGTLHWRALTPLECERLQTVPDLYTQYGEFDHKHGYLGEVKPISNSQRYKMLGNGFCVDTVANILGG